MSENTSTLEKLLSDFLQEGEVAQYDPNTQEIYALREGVQRKLELPKELHRKVMNESRKRLFE
jgi:hypothetical protein